MALIGGGGLVPGKRPFERVYPVEHIVLRRAYRGLTRFPPPEFSRIRGSSKA
jgi:hypothetical protein